MNSTGKLAEHIIETKAGADIEKALAMLEYAAARRGLQQCTGRPTR
jgi:hypothetical protein